MIRKTNLHDIPHVLSGDFSRGEFTPGISSQSCLVMGLLSSWSSHCSLRITLSSTCSSYRMTPRSLEIPGEIRLATWSKLSHFHFSKQQHHNWPFNFHFHHNIGHITFTFTKAVTYQYWPFYFHFYHLQELQRDALLIKKLLFAEVVDLVALTFQ